MSAPAQAASGGGCYDTMNQYASIGVCISYQSSTRQLMPDFYGNSGVPWIVGRSPWVNFP